MEGGGGEGNEREEGGGIGRLGGSVHHDLETGVKVYKLDGLTYNCPTYSVSVFGSDLIQGALLRWCSKER